MKINEGFIKDLADFLRPRLNNISAVAKEKINNIPYDKGSLEYEREYERIKDDKIKAKAELMTRVKKLKDYYKQHSKAVKITAATVGTIGAAGLAYGKYKQHKRNKERAEKSLKENTQKINITESINMDVEKKFQKNLGWALYGSGLSDRPTTINNYLKENVMTKESLKVLWKTVNLVEKYTLNGVSDKKDIKAIKEQSNGTKKNILARAKDFATKKYYKGKFDLMRGDSTVNGVTTKTPLKKWAKNALTSKTAKGIGVGAAAIGGTAAAALLARKAWKKRQAKKAEENKKA